MTRGLLLFQHVDIFLLSIFYICRVDDVFKMIVLCPQVKLTHSWKSLLAVNCFLNSTIASS
ncbi:CLUMA_CG009360, isoform A [Clunio marinus]|uniref:CLUMA_CG009360, isoform A n=1 Tax=Clunio marinus TaxID=568069 RepID=A0A1J1I848_9DIPT|nr:CLUMA_CG009360, isoform A [Clunio marinus]